ncbi:DUF4417 domain-containing protein [Bifidobacterium parmae]|uniref:DUF4417 domain-containing protein n=1 Tax=Bifidobacterium parmae TaxID=361854 RepID=A0A2N5IZB8_9BIFI|nr:DUF4417 domain-containing protein [Bifidobacterium parmae]PLS27300.1 hypothetical protein Uis4E_1696 [Bifidobacterium parmae]
MKTTIDDGFAPWLVDGATFDDGFPVIEPLPETVPFPSQLIPIDKLGKGNDKHGFVHFYLADVRFRPFISHLPQRLGTLLQYDGVITPDFSVYRDAPKPVQMANVYRSRAVGSYMQRNGIPTITDVCWADKDTYGFCFKGAPHHSIVSVSTVGIMNKLDEQLVFRRGFDRMMQILEPTRVIFNGAMPEEFVAEYRSTTAFKAYPCWTRMMKELKEDSNGTR